MMKVSVISDDIVSSRSLEADVIWLVDREVHVLAGAGLTVENGAKIRILNGLVPSSTRLRRAALIFDPGSKLNAQSFSVCAAHANGRAARAADNGGLWFLGTSDSGASDGIEVVVSTEKTASEYSAMSIAVAYLGCKDSLAGSGQNLDDIDAIKLLGVGRHEWSVSQVRSLHSADDGLDLTNSQVRMDRVEIIAPGEDCINLSSSRLEVRRSMHLDLRKTDHADRDLFDFETDDGPSTVELPAGCWIRVKGVFGDQLSLASPEMPPPDTSDDNQVDYSFRGRLKNDAIVYSVSRD
jgi:hypothetical protein